MLGAADVAAPTSRRRDRAPRWPRSSRAASPTSQAAGVHRRAAHEGRDGRGARRARAHDARASPTHVDVRRRARSTRAAPAATASGTINVSTMAALIAAGAGARVVKHGNRAASSQCGSADVLEALGVAIELGPDGVARCVDEAGIGFCFAPRYHPAMRFVGPGAPRARRADDVQLPRPARQPGARAAPGGRVSATRRWPTRMLGVLRGARRRARDGVPRRRRARRAHARPPRRPCSSCATAAFARFIVDPVELGIAPVEARRPARRRRRPRTRMLARRVLDGERGPHRDIALLNAAAASWPQAGPTISPTAWRPPPLRSTTVAAADVLVRLADVSQREAARA